MFRFQGFRSFNSLFHRSQSFRLARLSSQPNVTDGRVARKGMYQRYHNRGGLKASALVAGTLAISAGIAYDVTTNTNGFLAKQFAEIKKIMEPIKNKLFGAYLQEVFEPTTDKILPDWGDQTFYPGVPKGSPAPPLLIVDLEKTLIGSVYDAKHGWRHVKRPGLDRFIKELSAYYEIAIISENDLGLVEPVLMAIDPEGRCHKFGPNVSEMRGIHILKRLDLMNRDIRKIILIDDDPNASQLFPRNTLLIKPYTDIRENDRTLEELIPLLQAFVHEDPRDFRDTIDSLGTHDASECAIEYRMRVERKKQEEQEKRRRGLGGVIRGSKNNVNTDDDDYYSRSSILSPKDIVGGVPVENLAATASFIPVVNYPGSKKEEKAPVEKKKGLLFKRLDEMEKQKEEEEMRKREVMLRIQNERMMAMQKQQQQQQQQ